MAKIKISKTEKLKRFENGLKWLNKIYPGWESKIDKHLFDFRRNDRCVLGQLFGGYCEALVKFEKNNQWANRHGFRVDAKEVYENLWRKHLDIPSRTKI